MAGIVRRPPKPINIWWPAWLYESMPFIYAIAGLATTFRSDTPAGYGVGVMLLLAALLILKMRKDYRHFNETIELARNLIEYSQDKSD